MIDNRSDKEKAIGGFFWKFAERISSQGVSFVLSVILARLLMPEEYGLIAMINIFIVIANVFVTSGFTAALIQKKDADDLDFSTMFYCTFSSSILLYLIVYIAAPYIANFYNMPSLTSLTRVYGLSLIITSYQTIQQAYISRHLLFKKTFIATFSGTLVSGCLGVAMAYCGFGVWALVGQYLSNIVINTAILSAVIKWHPKALFSRDRAKSLMSFGSKVLAGDLIGVFVQEIRQLLIGKYYTAADLALYNRGNHLPQLVSSNLDATINTVLFPVMSNHSNDRERVKQLLSRSIRTSSYLTFFFLTMLAVMTEPIIRILLTEKWIDCVPYMQIICISKMLATVSGANIQAMKAIGRSDEVLKLEVFKKPVFLLFVFISAHISVFAVVLTMPLYSIYAMIMNMKPTKRLLDYGFIDQLKDLLPATLLCISMAATTLPLTFLINNDFFLVFIQFVLACLTYALLSFVFKVESFNYCKQIIVELYNKKMRKRNI